MQKSFFTSCFHLIIVCGIDLVDLGNFLKLAIFSKHERKSSLFILLPNIIPLLTYFAVVAFGTEMHQW